MIPEEVVKVVDKEASHSLVLMEHKVYAEG